MFADEFDEMERRAIEISSWGDNVYLKIPSRTPRESLRASYGVGWYKPAPAAKLELYVSEDRVRRARELMAEWGYDPTKALMATHPSGSETVGSSEPPKRWLLERFGQLADMLIGRADIQNLLLRGPGDEPFVAAVLANMRPRPLGVVSGLELGTFAAVIQACDLAVANDSGAMHIAAAQDVPLVFIFSPRIPSTFLPLAIST